eukprot:TRINITY_DN4038_c0_g1_i1.p1 TRINITY_DN4038_c0_g1~~TRINITY_DN4038_c0_g1_i1.p1  ORF type:complete len:1041 (-),score=191.24 TRINITY_DN4038_c0_g1_i1:453-3575(-)
MQEQESQLPVPQGLARSFHPDDAKASEPPAENFQPADAKAPEPAAENSKPADAKAPEPPAENSRLAAKKKWICSECFDPNDECRDFCDSCKTPRPGTATSTKLPPAQPTESHPSEEPPKATERWTCLKCDEPNRAERAVCNNCNGPRPTPPEPWVCPRCDEANKAERDKCNNCGRIKGNAPSAEGKQGCEPIISLDSSDEESKPSRSAVTKSASSPAPKSDPVVPQPVSSSAAAAATAASKAPSDSPQTKKARVSSSSSSSSSRSSSSSSSSAEKFIGGAAERSRDRSRSERRRRRIERAGRRSPSNQVRRYMKGAGPGLDGRPLARESTDYRAPRRRSRSPWRSKTEDSKGWHDKSDNSWHQDGNDKGEGWNDKDWNGGERGSGWWSSQASEPQASQTWGAGDHWGSNDGSKQEKQQWQDQDWKGHQAWHEDKDNQKNHWDSSHDSGATNRDRDWQGHQSWEGSDDGSKAWGDTEESKQKEAGWGEWKQEKHMWQDQDWKAASWSTDSDDQKDQWGGNHDSTARSHDWDWQADKSWGAGQADQQHSWGGSADSKAEDGTEQSTEKQAGWDEWSVRDSQWQGQGEHLQQSLAKEAEQNISSAAWSTSLEHHQDDSSNVCATDEDEFKRPSNKPPLPSGKPPLPSGKPPLPSGKPPLPSGKPPRPTSRKEALSPPLETEETFLQPTAKIKAKKLLPSPLSRDPNSSEKRKPHVQLQNASHSDDDGKRSQMEYATDGGGEGTWPQEEWDDWNAQKRWGRDWNEEGQYSASKDEKDKKEKKDKKERKERKRNIPDMPEKLNDGRWEERRADVGLSLVKDLASMYCWTYPFYDDSRRSFAGYLRNPWTPQQCDKYFEIIRSGTEWLQPSNDKGVMPRKTAWLVNHGCECIYKYGPFEVPAKDFPPWMLSLMSDVMPYCGLTDRKDWPNSCNMNLYEDGGSAVGWHSDDEMLFQGKYMDICIISLSFGVTRTFELRYNWPEEGEKEMHSFKLGSGDLMTMEGMTQKHMQHRVPRDENIDGPRINLTWRWVVKHTPRCPAGRCRYR